VVKETETAVERFGHVDNRSFQLVHDERSGVWFVIR
jgi:hypothetical protein